MTLRPYQARIVEQAAAAWEWCDRVLVVAPTGAGKTLIAAALIKQRRSPRVLFLAERLSLVDQARREIARHLPDITVGIMQANRQEPGSVIVASQQTVESRGWPPGIGLAVVDEAHIQRAEIMDLVPDGTSVLGLTATPLAAGMAECWQTMVSAVTTRELIDSGHLVDVRVLTHDGGDLSAPVRHWSEHADGRPTIGFAESCEEAFELADKLPGHWEVCWHGDSTDERQTKIDGFRAGRLTGLLSVEALGRGFDVPAASCLLAVRRLRSLSTWLQQLGRVMRTSAGKAEALVLDCAGNWQRLGGLVLDYWRLGPPPLAAQRAVQGNGGTGGNSEREASAWNDDDLLEAAAPPPHLSEQERLLWYAASTTSGDIEIIYRQLLALAESSRSPNPGKRAMASYRGITGHWPPRSWHDLPSMPPSSGVRQAADISYMAWRRKRRAEAS